MSEFDKQRLFRWLGWGLAAAVVTICAVYGEDVPFHEQWPLYTGLRATAGIIFGVLGAWIAIIYPRALKNIFGNTEESSPSRRINQVRRLKAPMWYSTLVLVAVLVVGLVEPILKQFDFLIRHRSILRAVSLAFLGGATSLLLWSVLLVVAPVEEFDAELQQESQRQDRLDALRANVRKESTSREERKTSRP